MDDDEFDDEFDEIPDEDLMLALTQADTTAPMQTAKNAFQDLPSDAFDSSPEVSDRTVARAAARPAATSTGQTPNFRQTTLWGDTLQPGRPPQSQSTSNRPYRADLPPEVATHHELNHDALSTWVYPLNLGEPRDYQFNIVKHGLFNNTLVALPTGLGKTFIAATIMLNYVRWTKTAKIVFVAPTKPLASQQVQACLNIVGIPRSQATLLTGETPPVLREGEWESKRLFFMTPQTLMNDLSKGYADPKSIALLVIDEAHRATGDYAYVKVVQFIRRFSQSFRVLALTATPGSSVEGVQDVIDNLGISHVEIRTEDSLDLRQYVHSRDTNIVTFDPSDEMNEVRDLFSKALKPLASKLSAQNIYYGRDPMSLTTFGLLKSRAEWMAGPGKHANQGVKFSTLAVFAILQGLAHAIKLLNFHGIKPFYHSIAGFRSTEEEKPGAGSKLRRQLLENEHFQKMMAMIEKWMKLDTFNGHPKLSYLCETLVNHFMDAGEGSSTRAIVFSEYRDSAEEIVRILNNQPLIKATVFVGQADSKRSEGMKQKQQIETIEKFKTGAFNVLVATSIGEEGLDIGQVDLIVCYDASSSPIRMLQRMGRTGRKRAGNIVLLLMKGKEEDKFAGAKDNYQKMQELICDGSRFAFRHDLSTRIVPRDIRPEVVKRIVDIPLENSQNTALPEPKRGAGPRKKPAKKKFNMPDGVETGFTKASMLGLLNNQAPKASKNAPTPAPAPIPVEVADVPTLDSIALSKSQADQLKKLYKGVPCRPSNEDEVDGPNLGAHPAAQKVLRRTVKVKHSETTKRYVRSSKKYTPSFDEIDTTSWTILPGPAFAEDTDAEAPGDEPAMTPLVHRTKPPTKPPAKRKKARQGGKSLKRVGDHFEDVGDDCTRTSDMEETDGSDSGADLLDFVVDDNVAIDLTSSLQRRSTSPTTPGSPFLGGTLRETEPEQSSEPVREKPFFVPVQFTGTQETDEDLPDLDTMMATDESVKKAKRRANLALVDSEDDDSAGNDIPWSSPARPAAKRRKRIVVVDSDD
ncbi:hypothetical protein B0T17DRAFT_537490, partial [Bombardia bombarda]